MMHRFVQRPLLHSVSRNPAAAGGLLALLAFVAIAALAPLVAPHPPGAPDLLGRLQPPAWLGGDLRHPLGTDHLGRDVLSRLAFGARIALIVGFAGVALASVIGVTLGALAGFFGGWVDALVSRVLETLIAVPNVLLYLAILVAVGPGVWIMVLVIGGVGWTTIARVVRAEVLAVRQRSFVEAARASGVRPLGVLARHVLPNVAPSIIVIATLGVANVILLEATLSFLGLGVQPPTVTWGRMLADGRAYLATAWWLATFPGLAITALCLALIFVGDWLRDVLDPRLRGR